MTEVILMLNHNSLALEDQDLRLPTVSLGVLILDPIFSLLFFFPYNLSLPFNFCLTPALALWKLPIQASHYLMITFVS